MKSIVSHLLMIVIAFMAIASCNDGLEDSGSTDPSSTLEDGGSSIPSDDLEGEGSTTLSNGLTINWSSDATAAQKTVLTKLVQNMVLVEGGTFMMGSNDSDANSNAQPVHSVTLTNDYYMGKFEVTQEEWVAVLGENPYGFRGANLPVDWVSWNYIVNDFLPELNRLTALSFRLPTEAEWEFAARGGNKSQGYKYSGSNNLDAVAWYHANSVPAGDGEELTHPVGAKLPNELGLYDMSGNVSEWCSDWYASGYYSYTPSANPIGPAAGVFRVLRGSSWCYDESFCGVSLRGGTWPDRADFDVGFRLALDGLGGSGNSGSGSDDGSGSVPSNDLTINWSFDATAEQQAVLTKLVQNMVLVESGTFQMGSDDYGADSDEQPVHTVTLTNDYYMGKFEVTQEEWVAVMGENPSEFSGTNLPVEKVSWNDIVNDFLPELNRLTGLSFRLPTEVEWEFAARGGNKSQGYKYSGSNNIDDVAWYGVWYGEGTAMRETTYPVGIQLPNELGLYDMSGNVCEWCSDWYDSDYYSYSPSTNPTGPTTGSCRVLRGGYWYSPASHCCVSTRFRFHSGDYANISGFRLALSFNANDSGGTTGGDENNVSDNDEIGGLTVTWSSEATAAQKTVLTKLVQNMVLVVGGTFMMGSDDSDANSNEQPVHSVTLSSYRINKYELTQEEWVAVMDSNPSEFSGTNLPVERVTWDDIVDDFLPELNRLTGLSFRLPTEAEWEYAARGGNRSQGYMYSGSNTIDDVAWYGYHENPQGTAIDYSTYPVGTKQANELGLYDMTGNVWEWCSDWYDESYYSSSPSTNPTGPVTGSYRVLRGGSWHSDARYCRVSFRDYGSPGSRDGGSGFRLAL